MAKDRRRAAKQRRRTAAVLLACFLTASALAAAGGAGGAPSTARPTETGTSAKLIRSAAKLANRCVVVGAREKRFVAAAGDSYGIAARRTAMKFHLKPTALGIYLLYDAARRLLAAGPGGTVKRQSAASPASEWRIRPSGGRGFTLTSIGASKGLRANGSDLTVTGDRPTRFRFFTARRCKRYPEAQVGARGRGRNRPRPSGAAFGFADIHMHVLANLRAGGLVVSGDPFHRYGIRAALGRDTETHGPDGSLDITGNILRGGAPADTHDTHGWPTFSGWPVFDTYTHQQAYYVWIKRVWKAGLRILVAQAVEDEALCAAQPRRSHSCDETDTVRLAVRELRNMQDYIDAQSGGSGRGWFRIVTNSRQARRVVNQGKLAVVIGMETSSPFGCSEFLGQPQCTRDDIDRVLLDLRRRGVRSFFISHWVDNAFSGAALQGGAQGDFIDLFQVSTTGHPFATEPCGAADEAEGTCNSKGLTDMGRYLFQRMMDMHLLIEADHLSQKARPAVFEIAERNDYPLVSSHTNTGGEWTPSQLQRLCRVGGIAAATPEIAPDLIDKILRLRRDQGGRGCGVALGSDTGGIAELPHPHDRGEDLPYPFRSYDGRVRFSRQRSGRRTFDLNRDGVAHYGLFADLLADVSRRRNGRRALGTLFSSAEEYLRMWEQAERVR